MEDESIIDLYLQRSQQAVLETKKKYGAYCRAITRNILSNDLDIEECENDTYLAAWNTIPPQKPRRLSVYLGRIARNISLDKHGYNTAKKRNKEFEVILAELEECLAGNHTVESTFEAGEIANVLNQFLYTLDVQSRNVFIKRYWYSASIGDICEQFHMSNSKVKSMLFRTRKKLKIYLEEEGIQL